MTIRALCLALILVFPPVALVGVVRTDARAGDQDDMESRQVTLFAVIASKDDVRIDPKLSKVSTQLRKLLPNHGFRLLSVKTKRLMIGQTLTVRLDGELTAATRLDQALDDNGKVQLKCEVLRGQAVLLESLVTTPANQLFFCDKMLPDGNRLLVGIGAR
jgi:hypothetical protein